MNRNQKKLWALLGLLAFSLQGVNAYALNLGESRDIEINACMPRATGWSFSCKQLADEDNDPATDPLVISDLGAEPALFDFGILALYQFDNPNTPDPTDTFDVYNSQVPGQTYGFYFECNAGLTGGVGSPKISFQYTEGQNPNQVVGQNNSEGLGYKAVLTVSKATNTSAVPFAKYRLQNIEGVQVDYGASNFTAGYPRFAVGLTNGNESGITAGAAPIPFSGADMYGLYTGTLTVTMDLDNDTGLVQPCN